MLRTENESSFIDTTDSSLSDSVALPLSTSDHDISLDTRHRLPSSPISPKLTKHSLDTVSPKQTITDFPESPSMYGSDSEILPQVSTKSKSAPTTVERFGKVPSRVSEERLSPILDVRSLTPPRKRNTFQYVSDDEDNQQSLSGNE